MSDILEELRELRKRTDDIFKDEVIKQLFYMNANLEKIIKLLENND